MIKHVRRLASTVSAIAILTGSGAMCATALVTSTSAIAQTALNGVATNGPNAPVASDSSATAVGTGANAGYISPSNDTAIGANASASGIGSTAIGGASTANSNGATALGVGTHASGLSATAIGFGASTNATNAVAVGENAIAQTGTSTIAVGGNAFASGTGAVAVGGSSHATGALSVATGLSATASGTGAVAIGVSAQSSGERSIAIGQSATVTGSNSVALGASSTASVANTVSIGSASQTRSISNMTAGVSVTDGVNVSQLTPLATALGTSVDPATGAVAPASFVVNGTSYTTVQAALAAASAGDGPNLVTQPASCTPPPGGACLPPMASSSPILVGASTGGTSINVTGTDGTRTLTGVSAGSVSAASTDAVNGSQLNATNQAVTANTASIAATDATVAAQGGQIAAQGIAITGLQTGLVATNQTVAAQGTTISGLATGLATTNQTVATHGLQIASLQTGLAATDTQLAATTATANGAVQRSGDTMTGTLNMGGNAVTGVRSGALTTTSTDAVNGSQLNATNGNVAGLAATVTTQGGQISNLTTAITAGTIGIVQQASGPDGDIAVGGQTGGTRVSLAGTTGSRTVTGVQAGALTAISTEAVNGSQLYATNQRVTTLETAVTQFQTEAADIGALKGQMNDAFKQIDKVRGGVAIALATSGFALEAGKTFGLGMNVGFYGGQQALAVQGAARLDRTWSVNGGVGLASNGGTPGGRIGLSAQW